MGVGGMSEAHEFIRLSHIRYGDTLVRVSCIVAIHQADESSRTIVRLSTGESLTVDEPFPVVSSLLKQALGLP